MLVSKFMTSEPRKQTIAKAYCPISQQVNAIKEIWSVNNAIRQRNLVS